MTSIEDRTRVEAGLVSVVIPTYNRGYIVAAAIESVLAQSYDNIEVVVVDDGSTDDTRAVVERIADSRVRYHHQANGGIAAARNAGLAIARGEFVAFLDSDDTWLPWKVEAQIRILESHPDAGMVWTDFSAVDRTGALVNQCHLRVFYAASYAHVSIEDVCAHVGTLADQGLSNADAPLDRPVYKGDIYQYMFLGNLVHTSTVLLRRDRLRLVGGFAEERRIAGEDYEFHLRTCSFGPVAFLDAPSVRYRVEAADQATAPNGAGMVYLARNNVSTVMAVVEHDMARIHLPAHLVTRRLAEAFRWLGAEELRGGQHARAARALMRSLRYEPKSRTAALLMLSALPTPVLTFTRRLRTRLRAR